MFFNQMKVLNFALLQLFSLILLVSCKPELTRPKGQAILRVQCDDPSFNEVQAIRRALQFESIITMSEGQAHSALSSWKEFGIIFEPGVSMATINAACLEALQNIKDENVDIEAMYLDYDGGRKVYYERNSE